jgi:hypothetical protein
MRNVKQSQTPIPFPRPDAMHNRQSFNSAWLYSFILSAESNVLSLYAIKLVALDAGVYPAALFSMGTCLSPEIYRSCYHIGLSCPAMDP